MDFGYIHGKRAHFRVVIVAISDFQELNDRYWGAPTIIRENWGSVKTFEFGHKKWVETPDIISNGDCWKPGQFSFKHTKTFPKILFRLGTGIASKLRVRHSLRET